MAGMEFKCPSCGGAIAFDSAAQQLKCPYCDSEFEIDALKAYDAELAGDPGDDLEWRMPDGSWTDDEAASMRAYTCNSCGGELLTEETTSATSCPYCDSPVALTGRLAGDLRPDVVVPFQLDKAAARDALVQHYAKKPLLPKSFKDENHIDELRGMYVPFWLFNADADARMRYRATRIRRWRDSKYDYTETSHFLVTREGDIGFENVPVDGSVKMPDDMMESLEPFDCEKAMPFSAAYLAGYLADRYDVDADSSIERANARVTRSAEQAFAATVQGYQSVTPDGGSIRLRDGGAKYALLPVWMLGTNWNGKRYTFAMNAQTGKFVGDDLPVDRRAYRRWFGGWAAGFAVLFYGLLRLGAYFFIQ
ncbi:MAG: hypothetical protein ACOYI5_05785 [Christensenellales bacterium]|jgi:DNA-directed RNA polymerase subunit RPC12/RpoP